jgi:hypothetical protein
MIGNKKTWKLSLSSALNKFCLDHALGGGWKMTDGHIVKLWMGYSNTPLQ